MLTPRPASADRNLGDHPSAVPGVLHPSCAFAGGQILAPRAPSPPHTNQFSSSSRSGVRALLFVGKQDDMGPLGDTAS